MSDETEETEDAVEPKRRQRWLRGAAIAVAVVVVIAAGLWFARLAIAERAIAAVLESQGIDRVEVNVDDLTFNEARLSGVKIGRDGALTIESAVARYSLADLFDGRVRDVVIDRAVLAMRLDPAGPSFGSLDKLLVEPETAEPEQVSVRVPFDRLDLRSSHIRIDSTYGPLAVAVGGEAVAAAAAGGFNATANLDLASTGATHMPGTLELAVAPDGIMTGVIKVAGGAFDWGPIAAQALSGTAKFNGKGGIDTLDAAIEIAELTAYDSRFREAKATLELADSAGAVTVRAVDATGKLGLTVDGKGRLDAKTLVARLDVAGHGTADAELWRRFGLPPARDAEGTMSLTLSGPRDDLSGDLSLGLKAESLELPDASFKKPEVRLAAAVGLKDERLTLTLRPDGEIAAAAAKFGAVDLTAPVSLPAVPGESPLLAVDLGALEASDFAIDARLGPAPVRGTVARAGKARAPFTATTPALALRGRVALDKPFVGTIAAKDGKLSLASYGFAAEGIDADVTLPLPESEGPIASLAIATLRQTGERPMVVPLKVETTVAAAGAKWTIGGKIHDSANQLSAVVRGEHDPATEAGMVKVAIEPLRFAADGFQPGSVFPALKGAVREASGLIGFLGNVSWSDKGIAATAKLLLKDLSATVEDIAIQRVNTVLDFDSRRPRSERQQVAVGLVDVGVPLTEGLIEVRIQPDLKLNIDTMNFALTGGRVHAQGVVIDPAATRQTVTLNVTDVNLGDLLQMTELEGLSATGKLSGKIPVVLDKGDAIVTGGLLSANSPGVLRYKPDQVPGALQGGGQGVELMLQALTDFHYDELSLSLDRDADGETRLALHLKGKNPAVYDGYPLAFNLNLSGKLDRILRDSLKGYHVPDTIQRKMLEFGK